MESNPALALEKHLELAKALKSDVYKRYIYGFIGNYSEMTESKKNDTHKALVYTADHSETYNVSEEMCDLIQSASESIPPWKLEKKDIPSVNGFVWLAKGLMSKDIHDKDIVINAYLWAQTEQGIIVYSFTDATDPRDSNPVHVAGLTVESKILMKMTLTSIGGWKFGNTWLEWIQAEDKNHIPTGTEWVIQLATLFRLLNEQWVRNERGSIPRSTARRLARSGFSDPRLRVVALRRADKPCLNEPGGSDVQRDYTHRWLVRGHWRNQWFPSIQDHKPRWIAQHLKGPEDKPLVVKETVFDLKR